MEFKDYYKTMGCGAMQPRMRSSVPACRDKNGR